MIIRPEIEIYPDPKYCGCVDDDLCIRFSLSEQSSETPEGFCSLYIDENFNETKLEYCSKAEEFKKCDKCKSDFTKSKENLKAIEEKFSLCQNTHCKKPRGRYSDGSYVCPCPHCGDAIPF